MDALKLVVDDRHLDEWVEVAEGVVIDVRLEVAHQSTYFLGILWRSVDDSTIIALEVRARGRAEARLIELNALLYLAEDTTGE